MLFEREKDAQTYQSSTSEQLRLQYWSNRKAKRKFQVCNGNTPIGIFRKFFFQIKRIKFFELFCLFGINQIGIFQIEWNKLRTNSSLTPPLIQEWVQLKTKNQKQFVVCAMIYQNLLHTVVLASTTGLKLSRLPQSLFSKSAVIVEIPTAGTSVLAAIAARVAPGT